MTDNSPFSSLGDDDQEMLDAIAAAFGPEALETVQIDGEIPTDDSQSLSEIVRRIDTGLLGDDSQLTDLDESRTDTNTERYILVEIGGAKFGIPMCNILEIQRVPPITYLPRVPDWVQGVVNIRGNIMSVSDLQTILGIPPTEAACSSRRLIVVQSLLDEIDAGLIVDRVFGIRGIPQHRIEDPTAPVSELIAAYLQGVYALEKDLVGLLDIEKLLLSDTFRQFETA